MLSLLALNWEPQLRGIIIIIIAVSVLCGSVYLILGTNLGARLGFLVSIAALSGWIMLMSLMWWTYGIGLKGDAPTWKAVPGQAILQTPNAVQQAGVVQSGAPLPDASLSPNDQATAIDKLLVANGFHALNPADTSFGQSAAAAGVVVEEDGTLKAGQYQVINVYDKGGQRYPKINNSIDFTAFLHKPHYIVAEVAPLLPQRDEPGRAPAKAELDATQPHRFVYMFRDLGNLRVPAATIAIGSMLIFLSCCYMLHSRDRKVILNRSAGLAIPAKE